jgi:threonine/homoserine/homoserine lactone efflux protein
MSGASLAILGGIWLSLLYSAAVMPASVWVIQVTVSRRWLAGGAAALGLSLGQLPWCLLASAALFEFPQFWQAFDLHLRICMVLFLLWMASRCLKAPTVKGLKIETSAGVSQLFRLSLWRSFVMPWRLAVWAAFIVSIGIHLRGPGWQAAVLFSLGAVIGQLLWHVHFMVVAGLFGHRVPEDISLHSLNKLRLLSVTVSAGLGLIILAPVAFPPV